MQSPQQFAMGLGKGTGSLISGVVTGAISSTATILSTTTGTVSHGAASILQQDVNYTKQREQRLRKNKVNPGGVMSGLISGGENVVTGFTSGKLKF